MINYINAFIFYTFAMVGVILVGFIIYKKTIAITKSENKGMIKIIDCVSIAPKKNLLVVKIRNEEFLIASDAERTTFLSKLDYEQQLETKVVQQKTPPQQQAQEQMQNAIYEQKRLQQEQKIALEKAKMAKLNKIHNQFKQLYNQDEIQQTPQRKAMVRKLLKDLDDTTGARGGRY